LHFVLDSLYLSSYAYACSDEKTGLGCSIQQNDGIAQVLVK
jgi:hypothetical protein